MSSQERLRFGLSTWAQGTRGTPRAHDSQRPVIKNMRLYTDNLLGPRPLWGERALMLPIAATDPKIFPIKHRYVTTETDGVGVVYGTEVEFYEDGADPGDTVTETVSPTYATLNSGSVGEVDSMSTLSYIDDTTVLINDTLIEFHSNHVSKGMTATDVGPALNAAFGDLINVEGSTVHQSRAYYWGWNQIAPFTRSRVWFSDSAIIEGLDGYSQFSSAAQYFDVDGRVAGCFGVGAILFIWTDDGDWTIMQGAGDPADATFNNLGRGRIPAKGIQPTAMDRSALFLSSDRKAMVTLSSGGTMSDTDLSHLGSETVARDYGDGYLPSIVSNSLANTTQAMRSQTTSYHNQNGVWTEEEWGTYSASAVFQQGVDVRNNKEMLAVYVLVNPVGGRSYWQVFFRDVDNDAPTNGSSFTESYAGDVLGEIELPRIFEPTKQVRVARVFIDGVTWTDGDSGNGYPAAGLEVHVEDGKGNSTELVLNPGVDPLSSVGDTERKPFRIAATGTPTQFTHFSDIKIKKISGVAFEAITVIFDISEGPLQ